MKQVDHENILPFYGMAASTPFDFCLVFPWYENGGIMDYLKGNPDIDRYWLVSPISRLLNHMLQTLKYLNFPSSYWARSADWAFCTARAWSMVHCNRYV